MYAFIDDFLSVENLGYGMIVSLVIYIINKERDHAYTVFRNWITGQIKQRVVKNKLPSKEERAERIAELNQCFQGEGEIFTIFENVEPTVKITGDYHPDSCLDEEIERERAEIKAKGFDNEACALLKNFTDLDNDKVVFNAEKTDFATVQCLRAKGEKPSIISAGGVLIDNEKQILIVHRRSSNSATYPGYYHILGGAFIPKMNNFSTIYDSTMKHTVVREISEETNGKIEIKTLDGVACRTFSKELTTGFIQYVYLGVNVSVQEYGSGNWEGDLTYIEFSKLEEKLLKLDWVPTGKMQILAWLAMGAPNSNYFKLKDALKIYHNVLDSMKKSNEE